ncbi:MAG: MBL fold metallo-hydrolase [Clostridia bacterium]|nr:MBL fold metallo-hydrolase [Clostridia bacterium]
MKIIPLYSNNHRSNTYLVVSGNKCSIIDPGQTFEIIEKAISEYNLIPVSVILTHGHFDHIYSLDKIREKFNIPAYIHENDKKMPTDALKNAYHVFFNDYFTQKSAENTFVAGDHIPIGDEFLIVIHTPGHTKGSSCLLGSSFLITGDTLFADSIGRTDMYSGNPSEMYTSLSLIKNINPSKDITIFPGHGRSENLAYALDNVIY